MKKQFIDRLIFASLRGLASALFETISEALKEEQEKKQSDPLYTPYLKWMKSMEWQRYEEISPSARVFSLLPGRMYKFSGYFEGHIALRIVNFDDRSETLCAIYKSPTEKSGYKGVIFNPSKYVHVALEIGTRQGEIGSISGIQTTVE